MNANRLFYAGEKPADIWVCGKCTSWYDISSAPIGVDGKTLSHEQRLMHVQKVAELCCNYRCKECGVATKQWINECDKCRDVRWKIEQEEKEQADFVKAKERTDYDGPFLVNDRVYENMEEVIDRWVGYGEDPQEYLWVPERVELTLDANDIVGSALEDHYDDASDCIGAEEMVSLQNMLNEWCKGTGVVSYIEHHKEYVIVPPIPELMEK